MSTKKFPFKLPLVLDGATGTELIKRGLPAGVNVQSWVLDHPEAVQDFLNQYEGSVGSVQNNTAEAAEIIGRYGIVAAAVATFVGAAAGVTAGVIRAMKKKK